MKALLLPCLTTLFLAKNCSLDDLQSMMIGDDDNPRIIQGKHSRIHMHKIFFRNQFMNARYAYTKNSIYTKLQSLLNSPTFYNYVTGIETINLDQCIRQGKIILFNLSKGLYGEDVSATLGRFIIAKIKTIALQRASLPPHLRKPIYLIIDEADGFLAGNKSLNVILKETRKYGLHLFLCTQNMISGSEQAQLKRNILSNTNVKIIGMNGLSTLSTLSKETRVPLSSLQQLNAFQFRIAKGRKRPIKVFLKNALGPMSPLLLNRYKVRATNNRIIKQTPYYKATSSAYVDPEEWIEDLPFDTHDTLRQEEMPKPKFTF